MIVVKSNDTEEMAGFIATLIPTSNFVFKNRNPIAYSYLNENVKYSGLVILKLLTGRIH